MNYRDRLARKAERRKEWAEGRARKATESFQKAHDATKHIPMGQPILVGHHSEGRHRAALRRSDAAGFKGLEHHEMAEAHAYKAARIDRAVVKLDAALESSTEDYEPGDKVRATFTANHSIHVFEGEVIDRTLNFWKIRATTSPYDGSHVGHVFRIPCEGRKGHTKNNRIIARLAQSPDAISITEES